MGLYRQRVLPRLQDVVMSQGSMRDVRARVCAGLTGEVVEVGFGTGLNVAFYPEQVSKVFAIEPSRVCMRIAQPRIAKGDTAVEPAGLDGQRLDLPSGQFDAALSTWTFCTIPDLAAALSEIERVLKPGGRLHFVEHGHSPHERVARWQRRLEPVQKRLGGGCHLTRRIPEAIRAAGFEIEEMRTYYLPGEPKPWGYTFEGSARKPSLG